jgi:hypothetical protein
MITVTKSNWYEIKIPGEFDMSLSEGKTRELYDKLGEHFGDEKRDCCNCEHKSLQFKDPRLGGYCTGCVRGCTWDGWEPK